jgi:hypothetical protein
LTRKSQNNYDGIVSSNKQQEKHNHVEKFWILTTTHHL